MKISCSKGGGVRRPLIVHVTTQHSASSYGQPVLVMPDGSVLDADGWALLDCRIEEATAQELELLRRSSLAWPGSPAAAAIASARSKRGRPVAGNPRRRISLTLPADEVELLRCIGDGSASAGVSRLLAERGK